MFQSTRLCEPRQALKALEALDEVVSIHAALRAATHRTIQTAAKAKRFNPRGSASRDNWHVRLRGIITLFQSTRLCEPRLAASNSDKHQDWFQSTRLCEPRPRSRSKFCTNRQFQSTRLCEPRPKTIRVGVAIIVFQSTRLCEPRLGRRRPNREGFFVSIHAALRAATR